MAFKIKNIKNIKLIRAQSDQSMIFILFNFN